MRAISKDIDVFTGKVIYLDYFCTEFTPIAFHKIVSLEDHDLARIDLRSILSSALHEHVVPVKFSERRWKRIMECEKYGAGHFSKL